MLVAIGGGLLTPLLFLGFDHLARQLFPVTVHAGEADGLELELLEADAERMPLPDASFDAVLSTFGVMFSPDHQKAAAEMLRVVRPGGKIVIVGIGKSGNVGQKIAATLTSTGSTSVVLDSVDALHGDLGADAGSSSTSETAAPAPAGA